MTSLLHFYDMYFQLGDPLHILVSWTTPTPTKVVKTSSCCPVLEGSALKIHGVYLTEATVVR